VTRKEGGAGADGSSPQERVQAALGPTEFEGWESTADARVWWQAAKGRDAWTAATGDPALPAAATPRLRPARQGRGARRRAPQPPRQPPVRRHAAESKPLRAWGGAARARGSVTCIVKQLPQPARRAPVVPGTPCGPGGAASSRPPPRAAPSPPNRGPLPRCAIQFLAVSERACRARRPCPGPAPVRGRASRPSAAAGSAAHVFVDHIGAELVGPDRRFDWLPRARCGHLDVAHEYAGRVGFLHVGCILGGTGQSWARAGWGVSRAMVPTLETDVQREALCTMGCPCSAAACCLSACSVRGARRAASLWPRRAVSCRAATQDRDAPVGKEEVLVQGPRDLKPHAFKKIRPQCHCGAGERHRGAGRSGSGAVQLPVDMRMRAHTARTPDGDAVARRLVSLAQHRVSRPALQRAYALRRQTGALRHTLCRCVRHLAAAHPLTHDLPLDVLILDRLRQLHVVHRLSLLRG
jgi:hypothetical protein